MYDTGIPLCPDPAHAYIKTDMLPFYTKQLLHNIFIGSKCQFLSTGAILEVCYSRDKNPHYRSIWEVLGTCLEHSDINANDMTEIFMIVYIISNTIDVLTLDDVNITF